MRRGCLNLMILIVFYVIPRLTTPVESILRRVVVETFPPYSVIVKIVADVCENRIAHYCRKRVRV